MKKIFLICSVAIAALAFSTSANTNNYYYSEFAGVKDTTPPMMTDSMHHGAMKMHKKGKTMKDSSMSGMHSDSTSTTAPPKK